MDTATTQVNGTGETLSPGKPGKRSGHDERRILGKRPAHLHNSPQEIDRLQARTDEFGLFGDYMNRRDSQRPTSTKETRGHDPAPGLIALEDPST